MRKSGIIITSIAVAAVAAVVISTGVDSSSERDDATSFERSARMFGGTPSPSLAPSLEIGTEHVYEVAFAQTVSREGVTTPEIAVGLDGEWAVAYAGSDERGQVFRAELRAGKPSVRRGDIDASAAFTDTLRRPYYFTTTAEGRLIELHFDAQIDDLTRITLGSLASSFQVSARSNAASWEAVESDSLGDYRARYVRGDELHRERVGYDRVTGGHVIGASIVKTGTAIAMRADGWPARIAGAEVTRIGTQELGMIIDAKFTIRHRSVAHGVKPGWHDGLAAVAIDAATTGVSQDQSDRDLVAGASLPDLLAELARLGDDDHARGYQFLRIAALFRSDADAARAGARLVLDGAPGDTAGVIVGALGEAGTPAAQQALHDVLAAPIVEETRARAAIALGLTEAPTPATLAALATAARGDGDLAATATLAQGNAALRIRDDAPDTSAREIDALLARLERAATDDERAIVLRALGNTGDPRIVPALDRALAGASPLLRIAATEALRLVPGDAIDARILAGLVDGDGLVRAAAVFASGERDLRMFVPVFARAVRVDRELEVRRAIVGLAGARIDELPALRELVEYAAANEPDAELRATAKAFTVQPST